MGGHTQHCSGKYENSIQYRAFKNDWRKNICFVVQAFRMFDKDGSGKITKAEMEMGLEALGMETDRER
jgi:hypothetical protein